MIIELAPFMERRYRTLMYKFYDQMTPGETMFTRYYGMWMMREEFAQGCV